MVFLITNGNKPVIMLLYFALYRIYLSKMQGILWHQQEELERYFLTLC